MLAAPPLTKPLREAQQASRSGNRLEDDAALCLWHDHVAVALVKVEDGVAGFEHEGGEGQAYAAAVEGRGGKARLEGAGEHLGRLGARGSTDGEGRDVRGVGVREG